MNRRMLQCMRSCEGDTLEYIKPGKQGIAKIDTLKSTGKVIVKAKGNATVVIKATPVKKARYCLVGWYAIKNILQGLGAIAATITACMYEFTNSIAPIQKSFNCSITDNIDYWAELDTVQCYYTSIALNDVFIIFYGIMSGCVVIVATFGFFDIFLRLDLAKCVCCSISGSSKDDQCKPPTDSEIIKYCLGKNDDAPVVTMHVWPCQCQ